MSWLPDMLGNVLSAAKQSKATRMLVVTRDPMVGAMASAAGAEWTPDPTTTLNGTLKEVFRTCWANGETPLYVPADLPRLRASEIDGILRAWGGEDQIVLSPCHKGQGTNALLVPAACEFEPRLGDGSFARHLAERIKRRYRDGDLPGSRPSLRHRHPGRPPHPSLRRPIPSGSRALSAARPSLGILLPTRGLLLKEERPRNAELVLSLARTAEDAGIDSLWVGDSLTAKPRLEPLTTLAAVAARTTRARIGTSVLLAALRHPIISAHIIGTLDVLSGGRLQVGAGVGGAFVDAQKKEWRNVGVDPKERTGRLGRMGTDREAVDPRRHIEL